MPELQRIARILIHRLCQQKIRSVVTSPAVYFKRKLQFSSRSVPAAVPCHTPEASVLLPHDHRILGPVYTRARQLLEKTESPEGRLGNTAVGHKPEASVEGCERHAEFLKNVSESPVRIGFIHISKSGKLLSDVGCVLIGIVKRAVGHIGSIELCNMYLHSTVFFKAVHNIPGDLQIGKSLLCLSQLGIPIMACSLRHLCRIMMTCHKIQGQLLFPAEFQKTADPFFILHTADGRTAHPESGIHFFHSFQSTFKEHKILFHIRILPETGQIRLIPDFQGPCHHFICAVALHQMPQHSLHQFTPAVITPGRRHMSLPVKNCLISGSQLFRHKSQFQKRFQSHRPIAVHHQIQIGKAVLYMHFTLFICIFPVDPHIIRKQSVTSDVGKPYLLLHQSQLLHVLLLQSQPHSSGSDAIIHAVAEALLHFPGYLICFSFHIVHSPSDSWGQILRHTWHCPP